MLINHEFTRIHTNNERGVVTVAQVSNLLYRGLPVGGALGQPGTFG